MNFGKYIHTLLSENEIVIVPGFGAFVSEYKPAEINENSTEIQPPSNVISFNQQIRNNDGLLVGYVAEQKHISHFNALKEIEQERDDILYKLDNGEQAEIANIGTLFYTDENTIGFTALQDKSLLLDSFGLETTSVLLAEETPLEENVKEEMPASALLPEEQPPVEENKQEETPVSPPSSEEQIEKETPEQKEKLENVKEDVIAPLTLKTEEEHKAPKQEKNEVLEDKTPEKREKRGIWWWLLLLAMLLIAATIFFFHRNGKEKQKQEPVQQEKTKVPAKTKQEEQAKELILVDSLVNDSTKLEQQDTVAVTNEDTLPKIKVNAESTEVLKYHLVGGSFSKQENAEKYLNKLKDRGYKAFHAGKKGRLFVVGIDSYATFAEAQKAKRKYMRETGADAWVWKK